MNAEISKPQVKCAHHTVCTSLIAITYPFAVCEITIQNIYPLHSTPLRLLVIHKSQHNLSGERPMEPSRHKSRNLLGFACCFAPQEVAHDSLVAAEADSPSSLSSPKMIAEFTEMKEKCRNLMNRFGKTTRRHSADFSYDPISYALNFEDARSDHLPLRDFPATPPRRSRC
ncbi:hypothetical protein QQ045_030278 [Rhodiola kirilowii]